MHHDYAIMQQMDLSLAIFELVGNTDGGSLLRPRFDFSKSVLVNANNMITDHEYSILQAKKTCNLPEGRRLSLLVYS